MENTEPKIPKKYLAVWQTALPFFAQGRHGDQKHSCTITEQVYKEGLKRGLDLDILIPAAILHDIGHAAILPEHLWMVTGAKKLKGSKLVHMLTGAKIAKQALSKINYDAVKIDEIVRLISIHDSTEQELFDTNEARLLCDIDKLARFNEEGLAEALEDFNIEAKVGLKLLEDEMLPQITMPEFQEKARKLLENLKLKYGTKD